MRMILSNSATSGSRRRLQGRDVGVAIVTILTWRAGASPGPFAKFYCGSIFLDLPTLCLSVCWTVCPWPAQRRRLGTPLQLKESPCLFTKLG